MNNNFKIKYPIFHLIFFLSLVLIYFIIFIFTIKDFTNNGYNKEKLLSISLGLSPLLILGLLGIYVFLSESFVYKNDTFYYNKPFLKNQKIRVQELKKVIVSYNDGNIMKMVFYDMNDKVKIKFSDSGISFKKGYFLKVLKENNIPIYFV